MKTENVMDLTKKAHKEGWKNLRGQQLMSIEESEEKTTEKFKDDINAYDSSNEHCKELSEALQLIRSKAFVDSELHKEGQINNLLPSLANIITVADTALKNYKP